MEIIKYKEISSISRILLKVKSTSLFLQRCAMYKIEFHD